MTWRNTSYWPDWIAADFRARPTSDNAPLTGALSSCSTTSVVGVVDGVGVVAAVNSVGEDAQFADRAVQHLLELGGHGHPHFGDVDVEHLVELAGEVEAGAGELGVFIDAAGARPAAPLDQSVFAVDVEALLSVPVERPGGVLERVEGTERLLAGQDVPANVTVPTPAALSSSNCWVGSCCVPGSWRTNGSQARTLSPLTRMVIRGALFSPVRKRWKTMARCRFVFPTRTSNRRLAHPP